METDDAKRGQVQRLTAAVNAYLRKRLNAYPTPKKPSNRLAWVLGALLIVGIGNCTGIVVGTIPATESEPQTLVERKGYGLVTELTHFGPGLWPFEVDEGKLYCESPANATEAKAVWVEVNGVLYPLNGTANSLPRPTTTRREDRSSGDHLARRPEVRLQRLSLDQG